MYIIHLYDSWFYIGATDYCSQVTEFICGKRKPGCSWKSKRVEKGSEKNENVIKEKWKNFEQIKVAK